MDTIDSLSRIICFLLRPRSRASAVAASAFDTALIAACLRGSCKSPGLEHNDLITFTKTRAPSLLTGIDIERPERARTWFRHDVSSCSSSASNAQIIEFATNGVEFQ